MFLSFISSAELNHDYTIKTMTQSLVYAERNRAPITHPGLAEKYIKFDVLID